MTSNASRRAFLRASSQMGMLGAAAPLGLGLAAATRASAATLDGQYKALVCVFLYGGNDCHNTIVPWDEASYQRYAGARSAVAVPRESLRGTVLQTSRAFDNGQAFALNPAMTALMPTFADGQLGMLMNVGTLNGPTTLGDYQNGINLPPKLMSHNDQFNLWQTSMAEGAATGWGGRIGDILASSNGSADLITNITVGSGASFSSGRSSQEFAIGEAGPVDIENAFIGGSSRFDIVRISDERLAQDSSRLLRRELGRRYRVIREGNARLRAGLAGQPSLGLPDTSLGRKLDMVARIIAANGTLGVQRQIFFVAMGGFDSHGSLNTSHPLLLQELAEGLASFQRTMNGLGMERRVTTFTASDFGRSLTSNGRGSDHGWGGHHFVMGGDVKSKHWVGATPSLELGGPDDIGQGRLLPAVSVDQTGATLAKWMGLSGAERRDVFPNIANFDARTLGFMA